MTMSFKKKRTRILIVLGWVLLILLSRQYPADTMEYFVIFPIVCVIIGFIIPPWNYFEVGWELIYYSLITSGVSYFVYHLYMFVVE